MGLIDPFQVSESLTVTTIKCRTKGKEIGRSSNRHGCIVVITMVLPFVGRRGSHDVMVLSLSLSLLLLSSWLLVKQRCLFQLKCFLLCQGWNRMAALFVGASTSRTDPSCFAFGHAYGFAVRFGYGRRHLLFWRRKIRREHKRHRPAVIVIDGTVHNGICD